MNAKELSQALARSAARVAEHLWPKGKKAGREWKLGGVSGEEGTSLSVCISGEKAGVWSDFATGECGDLLDAWMAARSCDLPEAIKQAKQYLGIRDDFPAREKKTFKRPQRPQCQAPKAGVREWLQSRGLTDETIAAFKVGEQLRNGKTYAVFPYLRNDELVNFKYRNIAEKRDMRQEAGAEPCLYGWHLIDAKARSVVIVEGEIDAMSLHQCGIAALSVHSGVSNLDWIDSDWERLECFSDIYVFTDCDEPGEKCAKEIIKRLGAERCRRVRLEDGSKDANEFLLKGASQPDFEWLIQKATSLDPEELVSADCHTEAVLNEFWPGDDAPKMPHLFLDKPLDWFDFHPGEYTAWTGWNGHGKSLLLDQVLLGLMQQGERVVVFSGELTAVRHLKRIHKQCAGLDRPSPEYIRAIGAWLREKLWIFDVIGNAKLDRLLEVFAYAARRYGATHFVIDSLMMLDVPVDGAGALSAQKAAVQKVCAFAKKYGVHVHMVAHPRKGRDESLPPAKMDIAGSLDIVNAADNVFAVWRNKKDEAAPDASDLVAMAKWQDKQEEPDGKLILSKYRHGDYQDYTQSLWFHKESMQYRTQSRRYPLSFVHYSNQD